MNPTSDGGGTPDKDETDAEFLARMEAEDAVAFALAVSEWRVNKPPAVVETARGGFTAESTAAVPVTNGINADAAADAAAADAAATTEGDRAAAVATVTLVTGDAGVPLRGAALRRSAFALGSAEHASVCFLNHGSYGATPVAVLEAQTRLVQRMERQPDLWFRRSVKPLWLEAAAMVAAMVGSAPADLVFVKNATAAVNAVVSSLELGPGDRCLVTNQTYTACANAVKHHCSKSGAGVVTLELDRADLAEPDRVVKALDAALAAAGGTVKFALLDHITSPTAVTLPVARLVAACKRHGVKVMIDGAHAPGNVPGLDVPAIGAEWFTGNLHKWVFAPKGSAFLWVHPAEQAAAQAPIISHEYRSPFHDRFIMQGTLDDTAFLAVPAALVFVEEMGGTAAIAAHNHALVGWAAGMLVDIWRTELYAPLELCTSMAVVRCPFEPVAPGEDLMGLMLDRFGIVVPIVPMPGARGIWARISAQLYNDKADYQRLAAAVLELQQERA